MAKKTLTYKINGIAAMNERVVASVFTKKLDALIAGLRAADKEGNGSKHFEYVIADLGIGSARVRLDAVETSKKLPRISPIDAYEECANALAKSDFDKALVYSGTVEKIAELSEGAGKTYSYADLSIGNNVIRIDDFLSRQAENAKRQMEDATNMLRYFIGVTHGAFDGEIKEVDLRGAIPQMKLVLSAGGKEIDCISKIIGIEEIRGALDRRVWVEGDAIYGGRSGLPERLEIRRIAHVESQDDIGRWRGSFRPFEVSQWEGDA